MAKHTETPLRIALIALAIIAVDQATKLFFFGLGQGWDGGWLLPVMNPTFALEVDAVSPAITAFVALVGIGALGGYTVTTSVRGRLSPWIPGLLLGGAFSNLLDRLALGAVRDFLLTPIGIVNLADVSLLVGVALLLVVRFRVIVTDSKTRSNTGSTPGTRTSTRAHGTRPPTRSSTLVPHMANESPTQNI